MQERTKQRDTVADKDRIAIDDDALNQAGAEKALNGNSAIHVNMFEVAIGKPRKNSCRISRHLFDAASTNPGEIESAATESDDLPVSVWPVWKGKNRLKRFAANDERIYGGHEFGVTVRFAAIGGQEVVLTVAAGDETIEADPDEDGSFRAEPTFGLPFLRFWSNPSAVGQHLS